MKLININVGVKIDNTAKIANFLAEQKADIITLQESLRHFDKSVLKRYKTQDGIERKIGNSYPYKFFGPLTVAEKLLKNKKVYRDYKGRVEQGNEIISKFPIINATNEFYYKNFSFRLDTTNWKKEDHGRAVLITELNIKGKKLQILNLHGIWTEDKMGDKRTMAECRYIIKAAKRQNIPTIIAGDFNLLPTTKSIKLLNKEFINLIDKYKVTSTRPDFEDGLEKGNCVVDYIFVNDKIKVNNFKAINTNISDHLPLFLDFEILK